MQDIGEAQRFRNNWWNKIRQLYTDNFPTDKQTYDMIIPVISLIFSTLNLMVLTSTHPYFYIFQAFCLALIYLLLTCSVTYQLYWGLKLDDRKQISLWILLKLAENIGSSIVYIVAVCTTNWYILKWSLEFVIVSPTIIGLNILLTIYVVQKSRKMKNGYLHNLYATTQTHIDDDTSTAYKNAI